MDGFSRLTCSFIGALTTGVAIAFLAGCGGSQPRSSEPKAMPLSRANMAHMHPPPPCFAGLDKWEPILRRWRFDRRFDKPRLHSEAVKKARPARSLSITAAKARP